MRNLLSLLSHYREIFANAWQQRHAGLLQRRNNEKDFLPDAIELESKSFSPFLAKVSLMLVAMIFITIAWSIFGKTDIVASANGRLVSNGYTKTISSLSNAKIKAIYVQNGDHVVAGQDLILLDDSESAAQISKLTLALPLLTKKADAYRQLYKSGYASEHEYFEKEQARLDVVSQLEQARFISSSMRITAPVDGIVSQLSVHTIGGVVTIGQQLALIVPKSEQLFLEAYLENKDVGFVREEQEVSVKLEAFPYTRYGLINGKVISIASDSIERSGEKPVRQKESDGDAKTQTNNNYLVKIALEKTQLSIDGKQVALMPGMVATGEIKTGSRRLISYVLSPLVENAQEAARER